MGIEFLIFTFALILAGVGGICLGEYLKRRLKGSAFARSSRAFKATLGLWICSLGGIVFGMPVEHQVMFTVSVFVMVILIPVLEIF